MPADFRSQYAAFQAEADAALQAWLPAAADIPPRWKAALDHPVFAGGKRLRPVLVYAGATLGARLASPAPAAAAIELIHTYSLVHDDLPAMDDSDLRRGQATVHKAFDEATAVLVGDALLTQAFVALGQGYPQDPALGQRLTATLAVAAGSHRLIAGQYVDTFSEGTPVSGEQLDYIHRHKTAALIETALLLGLWHTDASADDEAAIRRYGRALGLAFQVVDDILDATSDESALGKPVQADAARDKNTYVSQHGLDTARGRAAELTAEAKDAAASLSGDATFLTALAATLEQRTT